MNRMNGVRCDEVGLNVLRCQAEVLGATELGTLQVCVCVLVPQVEKLQRKGLLLMHNSVQYPPVAWRGWVVFLLQLLIFPRKALSSIWKRWQDASTEDTHRQISIKWYLKKKKGWGGGGCHLHCSMKGVYKQKVQGRGGSFTSQYGG